ncbi:hypothetical protein C8J56DRAFT_905154 [Mycena floridula]|nr:hypothetical protein C8J56DRAFT_905154 [Mycena floridula]
MSLTSILEDEVRLFSPVKGLGAHLEVLDGYSGSESQRETYKNEERGLMRNCIAVKAHYYPLCRSEFLSICVSASKNLSSILLDVEDQTGASRTKHPLAARARGRMRSAATPLGCSQAGAGIPLRAILSWDKELVLLIRGFTRSTNKTTPRRTLGPVVPLTITAGLEEGFPRTMLETRRTLQIPTDFVQSAASSDPVGPQDIGCHFAYAFEGAEVATVLMA